MLVCLVVSSGFAPAHGPSFLVQKVVQPRNIPRNGPSPKIMKKTKETRILVMTHGRMNGNIFLYGRNDKLTLVIWLTKKSTVDQMSTYAKMM